MLYLTLTVHLYLGNRVQMSIKYYYNPEILSLTMDIRGPKKDCGELRTNNTSHIALPLGLSPPPPFFESYKT